MNGPKAAEQPPIPKVAVQKSESGEIRDSFQKVCLYKYWIIRQLFVGFISFFGNSPHENYLKNSICRDNFPIQKIQIFSRNQLFEMNLNSEV